MGINSWPNCNYQNCSFKRMNDDCYICSLNKDELGEVTRHGLRWRFISSPNKGPDVYQMQDILDFMKQLES
jgi:hypothetical protein